MNMQMCNNGHFYDADVYAECPSCRKEAVEENNFPKTGMVTEFPTTGSYMAKKESTGKNSFPKTSAVSNTPAEFPKTAPISSASKEFPKTAPISRQGSVPKTAPIGGAEHTPSFTGWNPVLGWLVCVQGGKKGKDFRLTQEKSYIGRAASNDICLEFDEAISRDTAVIITYIKEHRVFRLEAGQSRNPVCVNGVPVLTELYLRDRDVISVGTTELKLICFCDTSFAWEN